MELKPIIGDIESVLNSEMKEFPHLTHLDTPTVKLERLRGLLETVNDEFDEDDVCSEETVSKLNFKTWIYTKLENIMKAKETNDKVVEMTNSNNITSLGNGVFLHWRDGKETDALRCLAKLRDMKKRPDFHENMAIAKAELAYAYSRISGSKNLLNAVGLLESVTEQYPQKFYWKLRLGVIYRRCTHLNIYTTLPNGLTLMEYFKKAVSMLTDVIDNSENDGFRGPAYSELAVLSKDTTYNLSKEDYDKMFKKATTNDLCGQARQCCNTSTWVLTNCGKIMMNEPAIAILEDCLKIRKHTTTHHHLGKSYKKQAEQEAKLNQNASSSAGQRSARAQKTLMGTSKSQQTPIRQRVYKYPKLDMPSIKLPNEYYNKAEREFEQAIKLSHNRNIPALYSLGMLYMLTGQDDRALEVFNRVTNNGSEEHKITIIKAYEQAGLIYLKTKRDKFAEDKFSKAISLAATIASSCPELQDCAPEMWQAFGTLKDQIEAQDPSLAKNEKLIRLYELVKNYSGVVTVVDEILNLKDSQFRNPDLVPSALRSYLQLDEPEKALTFLNMISTRPDVASLIQWESKEIVDLKSQVFLKVAKSRLQLQNDQTRFAFQELFKLHYGQCLGCVSDDSVEASSTRDVLLFYDGDNDTEDSLSHTSKLVQVFVEICSEVFGLDASINLHGSVAYGPKMSAQLEEMKRFRVVVVIVGEEERNCEFQALLEMIPSVLTTGPSSPTLLVIDTCRDIAPIPDVLKFCGCFRFHGDMLRHKAAVQLQIGQETTDNIIRFIRNEDQDAFMRLFRFLIKQDW